MRNVRRMHAPLLARCFADTGKVATDHAFAEHSVLQLSRARHSFDIGHLHSLTNSARNGY